MPLVGGAIDDIECLYYLSDKALPVWCQHDSASVSLEERHAEPVFDRCNASANCPMRDATGRRGCTERSRLSDQAHGFEVGKRRPGFLDVFQIHTSLSNCALA
jgi:hypothetical protein